MAPPAALVHFGSHVGEGDGPGASNSVSSTTLHDRMLWVPNLLGASYAPRLNIHHLWPRSQQSCGAIPPPQPFYKGLERLGSSHEGSLLRGWSGIQNQGEVSAKPGLALLYSPHTLPSRFVWTLSRAQRLWQQHLWELTQQRINMDFGREKKNWG